MRRQLRNHPRIRIHFERRRDRRHDAEPGMLGSTDPYDYLHTFWSDQYEHNLQYAGHATRWDQFVIRGSLEDGKLVGFYLPDGQLLAAVGVDRGGDPELDADSEMAAAARLVAMEAHPDTGQLADEGVDLWSPAE